MFERPERGDTGLVLEIFGGFVVGLIIGGVASVGGVIFFIAVFNRAGKAGMVAAEILDLGLIALIGYWTLRTDRSPFRNGFLTGLSIAFILNTACGVVMLAD